MKLILKDGLVIASHANNQDIKGLYGDLEIVRVPDSAKLQITTRPPTVDLNNPISISLSKPPTADLPTDPRLNWSLKEGKENALLVLEDIAEEYRVELLSSMPGKIAGYEAKAKIAYRIVASDNPNKADFDALKLEAENRQIPVLELAQTIIKRAEEFANISTYIDGEAQEIKTSIEQAESTQNIWNLLKEFEQKILTKIQK